MSKKRQGSLRLAIVLAGLLPLVLFTLAPSRTVASDTVDILLETATSAAAGSCPSGERCVEQCTRYPNGSIVTLGIVCCAPQNQVNQPGVTCMDVGGIAGRFGGPI